MPRIGASIPIRLLVAIVAGFAFSSGIATARTTNVITLYVDGNTGNDSPGTGPNSPGNLCDNSVAPCQTIQRAVNAFNHKRWFDKSLTGATIKVTRGTYTFSDARWTGASDTDPFSSCAEAYGTDKSVVCVIDWDISIEGGYSTGNWNTPSFGPEATIVDGQNVYRGLALIAFNEPAHFAIKNLTIKNGLADDGFNGGADPTGFGGGVYLQQSSADIENVIFEANKAQGKDTGAGAGGAGSGGGIAITGPTKASNLRAAGTTSLKNVTFSGNTAQGGIGPVRGGLALGGGIFVGNGSRAVLENATFSNNSALAGSSTGAGTFGGLNADALGGAASFQIASSATLKNITATNNQAIGGNATTAGGGGFGGAIHVEESNFSMSNALLKENSTKGGDAAAGGVGFSGGIEVFNSNAKLERIQVLANIATSGASTTGGNAGAVGGGGAYFNNQSTTAHTIDIINSVFADNQIVTGQPGLVPGGGGGAMVVQGLTANITHSTFAQNKLGPNLFVGHALLVQAKLGETGTPGIANINYTIFADHVGSGNQSTIHVTKNSTINLQTGLFAGNTKDTNLDGVPVNVGTFTGLDSMLSAASASFVSPGAPSYNYHILAASPAIDKAVGSTTSNDIDLQSRPNGVYPDIGADEYYLLNYLYLPTLSR